MSIEQKSAGAGMSALRSRKQIREDIPGTAACETDTTPVPLLLSVSAVIHVLLPILTHSQVASILGSGVSGVRRDNRPGSTQVNAQAPATLPQISERRRRHDSRLVHPIILTLYFRALFRSPVQSLLRPGEAPQKGQGIGLTELISRVRPTESMPSSLPGHRTKCQAPQFSSFRAGRLCTRRDTVWPTSSQRRQFAQIRPFCLAQRRSHSLPCRS